MATAVNMWLVLKPVTCCECGVSFGMPEAMRNKRREDGQLFHCPNGHSQHYTETEAAKLRKQLEAKERALEFERNSRRAEENAHRATKGQLTKLRKRASNGVCPDCHRTFANVARHMKSKHAEPTKEGEPRG